MSTHRLLPGLISDLKRSFLSLRFLSVLLMGVIILIVSFFLRQDDPDSVLSWFFQLTSSFFIFILVTVSTIPYSTAFCEDLEHRYIYQAVKRCGLSAYIKSKCFTIFFSSMFTTILIIWVFLLHKRINFPFSSANTQLDIHEWEVFGFLIPTGNYVLFLFLRSVQIGLVSGILSLFSAFISLLQRNRLLIYALPFFTLYLQGMVLLPFFSGTQTLLIMDIVNIFIAYSNVWGNYVSSCLYLICVTIFLTAILYFAIFYQVKRRITDV